MIVVVTGASGFLGQYVVAEALRRGQQVRAILGLGSEERPLPWQDNPALEIARLDLRQPRGLVEVLQGADGVIHLAAAIQGDFATQYASTVTATENLLAAMAEANIWRLIGISTFSVFDYLSLPVGATVTEDSPLESHPQERDAYAQTKLLQEQLFRDFGQKQGGKVTILRPGIIYGRDRLWNAYLGAKLSDRLWLRIGNSATMPLIYVENCAEAIVRAVESVAASGQVLNLVDDNLPTQSLYAGKLVQGMPSPPRIIAIGWQVMDALARAIWQGNKRLWQGRVKLPGILIPARLHARFKPLHYSNARAKQVLGWTPKYSLDAALARAVWHTPSLR